MTSDAIILDGYVDEPACLGVPPYIAPAIRTLAGVLAEHGHAVRYLTIDQVRADPSLMNAIRGSAILVVHAGLTVPGNYLGGRPATLTDLEQIGHAAAKMLRVVGGPITFGYAAGGGEKALRQAITGFDVVLEGSPAEALASYLDGGKPRGEVDYLSMDRWAAAGAGIIAQHPFFPHVMCELETGRGCARTLAGGCSFCTERLYGPPRYRSIEGIAGEVRALASAGARHFRLGRQPDLLVYGVGGGGFPRPRPELVESLFSAIREAAPDLSTLHIDNVNPGTIARHEEASRAALEAIVAGHTPGDVAAFGMETADPAVVAANNLKASSDEVYRAIEIVNEVGARRDDGIPELLPGLNFVTGLAGETPDTFAKNEAFLDRVLASGCLVRRVNIRQLMPFPGTPAYEDNTLGKHDAQFRAFKEYVRLRFDAPMLRRVFPPGTILRQVIVEEPGETSFGRQMGSYPILVGIPLALPRRTILDAVVVDAGQRSVTGLPYPVEVNRLPIRALAYLPGIGRKTAARIVVKRPFKNLKEFRSLVGPTPIERAFSFTLPEAPSP
jgi:radical SAM superfamily enzyme with C-terminal helix-hairpin-helix motif